jgi:riboflavin biosynthesis pyrimidine reductase
MRPDEVATWEDIREVAREIYRSDTHGDVGLLHVAAVWKDECAGYRTLNLTPEIPRSEYDRFALNLSRARADAILTTGKILRSEPDLSHDFFGPPALRRAFGDWRRLIIAKEHLPLSVILTSGHMLSRHHPIFEGATRPMIFTSMDGRSRLETWAGPAQVEVVGVDQPSAEEALAYLLEKWGAETVSIEAGPSTALPLYRQASAPLIDELLLSVYLGDRVPGSVRGAPFLDPAALGRAFPYHSEPCVVSEPSGPWQFQRFTRRGP